VAESNFFLLSLKRIYENFVMNIHRLNREKWWRCREKKLLSRI